ncbi:4-hydroxy-tetrahydrodipicolinate reductase [Pseudokordiimonas caeni]|uniref:4-hydroxy-tetrahydrodipicolinate reductase n=1 Tax=Pseudokordiimonas caeni TaxID=2997908 RepID=UPI0028123CE5|nr:4-hydroxy-tetrahydrodipicolinate reductase [Pseudokordiimonas caeni]
MAEQALRVGIIGCMGRMGQAVAAVVVAADGLVLAGGTDRAGNPGMKIPGTDAPVMMDLAGLLEISDVVIDFSAPGSTADHAEAAAAVGTALVVGTTGLTASDHAALDAAGKSTAIVQAGNFSLGVNLLMALTEEAARVLGDDWDIDILEMHHRHKVDAPSGTALMLGEAAAKGRGVDLGTVACKARDGVIGERPVGEIGFATLRGGAVIGEHEVIFASDSERLILSHKAENRSLFAKGAVVAARFAATVPAGRYTMQDVLKLQLGSR